MTDAAKDQDQSMEEILQSIKRIIAEEGDPVTQDSGVLELTDIIDDSPASAPSEMTIDEIMAASSGDVLEHMFPRVEEPLPEPAPPLEVAVEPEPVVHVAEVTPEPEMVQQDPPLMDDEPLVSEATLASASAALDVLKKMPADSVAMRNNSMKFRSGETVEDLVMESLKPMLREWLDDHLTELVERLVEREVRKITGR